MPMLLQPTVRTRQPRGTVLLDPKWAPRIYACVDAGNLVSYLNGSVGIPYVSLTTPARASGYWARKTDARGDLASAVSYDQLSTHLPRRATTVSELTLFAAGYIGAASGDTFQVLAAMMDLNGPTYIAYIAFDRTSGKLISGLFKGGAWTVLDSGITFEYGRTYRCSLTAKSGYAEMYVDGVRVATDTSAGWVSYTTFRDLCVGNSEYNYFRLNGGALVAGTTRAFSPADAKTLSANPWQIFRAPDAVIFPVASGTTLTLTDATHAHAADTIALEQQHQLVAVDASHSHAADAIALTQQHELATADASHDHTADAITLVQQHAIAIADAMHAHDVDALTLAVQSTLAMSDAAHAHAADNVTLAAAGTLAVADASHGHTVDAVTLTQQHLLALTDALHGHGSDVVTLNTGLLLAIADAVHAQSVDALVLSQAHVLVLADAAHAHLADAVALVMPGAITTLPDRTLVIAAESRALVIVTETRALAIGAEARVLTIH